MQAINIMLADGVQAIAKRFRIVHYGNAAWWAKAWMDLGCRVFGMDDACALCILLVRPNTGGRKGRPVAFSTVQTSRSGLEESSLV